MLHQIVAGLLLLLMGVSSAAQGLMAQPTPTKNLRPEYEVKVVKPKMPSSSGQDFVCVRPYALSLVAFCGHPSFVRLLLTSGASMECHPFGSFDDWLNWLGKRGRSPEQAERIRSLFETERKVRASASA